MNPQKLPRRSGQAVNALMRALRLLAEELSLPEVLEALLDMAIDSAGAARGFLVLVENQEIKPVLARNYGRFDLEAEDQEFSRSIIHLVLESKEPILTDDAGHDPRFLGVQSIQAYGLHSIICVPLVLHGEVRGVIYLDNPFEEGVFREEDCGFLSALASQAALVVFSSEAVIEQRRTRDLLNRYVSPDVATELLSRENFHLQARRQEVSVMFSDIRGFSGMAENADPVRILELLNEYYERMVEVVFRHRGTLITFLGDGVMVVFGAPVPSPDHAKQAISAAQELQELAKEYQDAEFPLRIGVGINSGESVVGDVGSAQRCEFAVIGHTTNVAARVEKLTSELGSPVLFTESTRQLAGGTGVFVGERLLKGIDKPMPLYRPQH